MKILVLNGSPRIEGNCAHMIDGFRNGAEEAGHEITILNVGRMNLNGCLACEYCHSKSDGTCIQKDDMQQIYSLLQKSDMIVFASPIYYYSISAQLNCVIQRTYNIGVLENVKKTALILSSGDSDVYDAAIYQYEKCIVPYWKAENMGIFTAYGQENHSEGKWNELYQFGRNLK